MMVATTRMSPGGRMRGASSTVRLERIFHLVRSAPLVAGSRLPAPFLLGPARRSAGRPRGRTPWNRTSRAF